MYTLATILLKQSKRKHKITRDLQMTSLFTLKVQQSGGI